MDHKLNKRPWRKLVKKLQRKRRRQKVARERDKQLEMDELEKLKDPLYKSWRDNQQEVERLKLLEEQQESQAQEEQWLRRELIAQKQFQRDEQKRKAQEAVEEAARLQQDLEFQKQQEAFRKKRDELKQQSEKAAKEFEDTMQSMQDYLEDVSMKTPPHLEKYVESRPGEKLCEFYEKTNCCRFGPGCTYNHKRPLLSKIIVIRNFFQHPLLEQEEHEEYARADANLELNERDLRDSYDDFCEDVWPKLKEFGDMLNFRTVRNVQAHLRGHVFVEFKEKRSALKAFTNLQNRYYASKRLNVEFSNLRHWRTGVCGMLSFLKGLSLSRRCPKGFKCNFLHLMQNPNNKYNTPMESPGRTPKSVNYSSNIRLQTPLISWNNLDSAESNAAKSRNWRWSESPEVELKSSSTPEIVKTPTQYKESNKKASDVEPVNEKSSNSNYYHKRPSRPRSREKISRSRSPSKDKSVQSKHHHKRPFRSRSKEKTSRSRSPAKDKSSHSKHRKSRQSRSPSKETNSHKKHHNSRQSRSPSSERSKNSTHHLKRHSKSPLTNYDKTKSHHSKSPTEEKPLKHHKSRRSKSKSKKSKRHHSPEDVEKDKIAKESVTARHKSKKRSKSRSRSRERDYIKQKSSHNHRKSNERTNNT